MINTGFCLRGSLILIASLFSLKVLSLSVYMVTFRLIVCSQIAMPLPVHVDELVCPTSSPLRVSVTNAFSGTGMGELSLPWTAIWSAHRRLVLLNKDFMVPVNNFTGWMCYAELPWLQLLPIPTAAETQPTGSFTIRRKRADTSEIV